MKVKFVLIISMFVGMVTYGQRSDILTNDSLIVNYIEEFINEGKIRDLDIESDIISKVDCIMIAPDSVEVDGLGVSYKDVRAILISDKVRIDRVILKAILFRELSYMLGVPYGGNIIMNRKRDEWFSYYSLADPETMKIEMDRVLDIYRFRK